MSCPLFSVSIELVLFDLFVAWTNLNVEVNHVSKYARIVRVGVDLGQSVAQVHAVDAAGKVVAARQLQRSAFIQWCERLPQGCIVAFEACSAAHHLARALDAVGLAPRLISPAFATPYRMTGATGKNDATDAEAICEAASRPHMRFVPAKTPEQQAWPAQRRRRLPCASPAQASGGHPACARRPRPARVAARRPAAYWGSRRGCTPRCTGPPHAH